MKRAWRAQRGAISTGKDANCYYAMAAILLVAAVYVFWDADRPFNQTDEFLYSTVTLEMVRTGDFVTPRFAHIELLSKPPLFYWISAPFVASIDNLQVAMRILPGFSFLCALLLIFDLAKQHWTPRVGLFAALVYFLCYDHLFNHVYKSGVMEPILNVLMLLVLWLNMKLRSSPNVLRWIAVALGAALLTKSAFAVIPAAVTAANLYFNREEYRIARTLLLQSVIAFALVVVPWFGLALLEHGRHLFDYMFVDQVLRRATNDVVAAAATGRTFGRNEGLYVLRHILEYGQPWSFLVWLALVSAWRSLSEVDADTRTLLRLCCGWFVGVLLLFLVSRGRWSWYVSSVYIPASILIAAMFQRYVRYRDAMLNVWLPAAIVATFLISVSPFKLNPYSISSGAFPLFDGVWQQFVVWAGVGVLARWAIEKTPPGRRADWGMASYAAVAIALAILLVAKTFVPSLPFSFSAIAVVSCMVVGVVTVMLLPVQAYPGVRKVVVLGPVFLGIAYLIAPLTWSQSDNRRIEIKRVQERLEQGHLEQDAELQLRGMSLFGFMPIYAEFKDQYDVTYDPDRRLVSIKAVK